MLTPAQPQAMTTDKPSAGAASPPTNPHTDTPTPTRNSHAASALPNAPVNPPHQPLRHTLSLAELEAAGNPHNDSPFTLDHLDQPAYHLAVHQLPHERHAHVEQQRDAALHQLALLQRQNEAREHLQARLAHLTDQLAEKNALEEQSDRRLHHALQEGDRRVQDVTMRFSQDTGLLTERLRESLAEVDSLRKRCTQLENGLVEKPLSTPPDAESYPCADSPSSSETFPKSFVEKKMCELKIARNVIAEKDKILRELRTDAERAETRAGDAEAARASSESRAASLERELAGMQKELESARDDASRRQTLVQEAQEKLREMEAEVKRANEDTAAAAVTANESDEKRRGYKELLESTARRCHEALAEKQASIIESDRLRESLAAAEQEIASLGDLLQKEGNNADYLGSTSPCSLVTDPEPNGQSISSTLPSRPGRSLAELEEAASAGPSGPAPAKLEEKQPESPSSENEAAVQSLSRSLQASCLACDEKNEQLQEASTTVVRQEEALRRMIKELASRKEECEVLESRVREELTPALRAANKSLDEREKELKAVREEFDLRREMAEKTRSALELDVGSTTERLEDTLASLQRTRDELSKSQHRASNLEGELANLKEHRTAIQEKLAGLEESSDHKLQSLRVMQERLTTIESCTARHEQTVVDTTEEKERLQRVLAQEVDRREVAERRASRKDGLVLELETRTLELERNHAALKEHLIEKTEQITVIGEELRCAKEIAEVRDNALQEQARVCQRRESLFESLTLELRTVIQSQDAELRDTKEDLSNVERRVMSLTKCLEEERSKVKTREQELAEMLRNFGDSEAENRRSQAKLSLAEEQCSRLTAEYQAAQEELETREKQIASHLTSISEKSGKLSGLRAEKSELDKTVRELRNVLEAERSEFALQVSTAKRLEGDLETVRASLATYEADLSMRDTEVASLGRSLTNARNKLLKLEEVAGDKDDEISANCNVISTLEKALERSKHQLAVLESHLDGHDTLLKDNREKDESIAVQSGELNQAREAISQLERERNILHHKVSSKEAETDSLSRKVATLEAGKASVEEELERAKKARTSVEKSLNETSASLAALEQSTTEEIADLNATVASLKKVIDEKDSSLNSASETIAQSSVHSNLTKEQLIDSRTRGDRLFSRLTSTEYELASKKETLATLQLRFREIQEALRGREDELEKMGKTLSLRDQALSSLRSKIEEMSKKTSTITQGELLTMQAKLEAKEKAIANLHNWCCFINGKLHVAEKALSERDMDLEVSSAAFKKLESQLRTQSELLSEKESQMRKLESSKVVENAELRSRIHSLQSYVEEANAELERTKQMISSKGSEAHSSLVTVSEELVECKANLRSMEKGMSEVLSRNRNLEENVNSHERDLAASERTIECLTLDLGRLQSESSSKRDAKNTNDKNAAEEILKVRSETGYLIVELRKAEAELSAANETATTWQQKAEELQPLAESTLEAQRAVEIVSSQLSLLQKDSKQRIDLLEMQLKEAERERDAAERDCSAAIADYTAMRARLMEVHCRGSAYGRLAAANTLCTVTFTLEGRNAPHADIMVYILGEDATLGQWNPSRRLPIRVIGEGVNGVIRKCEVVLPASLSTRYKYAADGPNGALVWEGDENRSLDVHGDVSLEVTDVWRSPN